LCHELRLAFYRASERPICRVLQKRKLPAQEWSCNREALTFARPGHPMLMANSSCSALQPHHIAWNQGGNITDLLRQVNA
jgi:hypothetical protein